MKKIVFIINPNSGTGRYQKAKEIIGQKIDTNKYEYQIIETEFKGHAKKIAKNAVKEGVDIVISVGGDGTLNEISSALVHTPVTLGIIPAGSGNGLAHHINIPINLEESIKIINENYTDTIDTFLLNNKRAVSIAGVGFDAYVAWKYDKTKTRGFWPYFRLAFRSFFTYKSKKYILTIDNQTLKKRALFISFANSSQWGFNTKIAPNASLKDGKIDVCIMEKPSFLNAILLAPKLFSGRIDQSQKMEIIKCESCQIQRSKNKKMHIHIDGEKKKRKRSAEIIVDPLSLNIIIPKPKNIE